MKVISLILASALACSAPGAQAVDTSKLIDKALQLVNKENVGLASTVAGVFTALSAVNEEITSRQEHRQENKRTLRDKAAATADFVVWVHLDSKDKESKNLTIAEFCQMVKTAQPIMKAKTKRGGFFSLGQKPSSGRSRGDL